MISTGVLQNKNFRISINKEPFSMILHLFESWECGLSNEFMMVENGLLQSVVWDASSPNTPVDFVKLRAVIAHPDRNT